MSMNQTPCTQTQTQSGNESGDPLLPTFWLLGSDRELFSRFDAMLREDGYIGVYSKAGRVCYMVDARSSLYRARFSFMQGMDQWYGDRIREYIRSQGLRLPKAAEKPPQSTSVHWSQKAQNELDAELDALALRQQREDPYLKEMEFDSIKQMEAYRSYREFLEKETGAEGKPHFDLFSKRFSDLRLSDQEKRELVQSVLSEQDVPPRLGGYKILEDILMMLDMDPQKLKPLSKHVYPAVAKRHHMKVRHMEKLISYALSRSGRQGSNLELLSRFYRSLWNKARLYAKEKEKAESIRV